MNVIVPSESLVQRRYSMEDWLVLELLPNLPNLMQRCRRSSGKFLTLHKRRRKKLITRRLIKNHALLDDINHGIVKQILNECHEWNFNAFLLENVSGGRSLTTLSLHLFHWYGLIDYFKLDTVRIWKLFSLIEEGYHSNNPYHNAIHATDVMQAMHCFLQEEKIKKYLTPLEILTALLSAVAHDLDHPGVNQPFLIATSNHLAALYGNMSVLENHHWRSALCCLIDSGVAEQLTHVKEDVENQMKSLILATDIDRHQEFLLKFQKYINDDGFDLTQFEDRHFILQIALKCADISNPARPWELSRKWSLKVCEEFFRQGDYERRLSLPVTSLCDRFSTSIPKIQSRFLRFIVIPLFSEWHQFHKSNLSTKMIRYLSQNQQNWECMESMDQVNKTESVYDENDFPIDSISIDKSDSESEKALLNDFLQRTQVPNSWNPRRHSVPANLNRKITQNFGRTHLSLCDDSIVKFSLKFGSETSILLPNIDESLNRDEINEKLISVENLLPECTILSIRRNSDVDKLPSYKEQQMTYRHSLKRQQTYPSIIQNEYSIGSLTDIDDDIPKRTQVLNKPIFVTDRISNVNFNVPTIMISSSGSLKNNTRFDVCVESDGKSKSYEKENVDPQKTLEMFPRRGSAPVMFGKCDDKSSISNNNPSLSAGREDSCRNNRIEASNSNFRRGSMPLDIYHYHQDKSGQSDSKYQADTFVVQLQVSKWKILNKDSALPMLSDRILTRHISLNGKSGRRFKQYYRRGSEGLDICQSESFFKAQKLEGLWKQSDRSSIGFDGSKRRSSLPLEVYIQDKV